MKPNERGTYQITLLIKQRSKIVVGRLGEFNFEPGVYIYTGRASRGLTNRLLRHQRLDRSLHWHIDYLTTHLNVEILGITTVSPNPDEECVENQKLLKNGYGLNYADGFGSSDCQNRCESHLIHLFTQLFEVVRF